MGGPPRVADPGQRLRQRIGLQLSQQVAQLPGLLPRLNSAPGHHSNTGRVITPVLQTPQTLNHNIQSTMTNSPTARRTAYITHDSTHRLKTIGRVGEI